MIEISLHFLLSTHLVCYFLSALSDYSCDFDKGSFCGWDPRNALAVPWVLSSKAVHGESGPDKDVSSMKN